jgi:DedD protein
MGLLSNLFSNATRRSGATSPSPAEEDVNLIRARARRRLIGAAVLLAVGVIGFPLLFETQPRPAGVEVPAVIVRKDATPVGKIVERPTEKSAPDQPQADKAAATGATGVVGVVAGAGAGGGAVLPASRVASSPAMIVERAADAGREVVARAEAPKTDAAKTEPKKPPARQDARQDARPDPKSDPKPSAKPATKPEVKPEIKPEAKQDAKPAPKLAEAPGRFTVQVGAYAQESGVQDARSKLERAGMKTYIQVLNTTEGKRTRVRTGPYNSRDEAERAAQKAKALGMTPTVVPL